MGETSAQVKIVVDCPVAAVFSVMSDYNKNVRWQQGVAKSEQLTSGPPGVGTEVSYTRKLAGRDFEARAKIVEFEPDAKLRVASSSKLFDYRGGYDFRAISETSTEIHYQGTIKTSRLLGMFSKRLANGFKDQMTTDLRNLKGMLESGNLS